MMLVRSFFFLLTVTLAGVNASAGAQSLANAALPSAPPAAALLFPSASPPSAAPRAPLPLALRRGEAEQLALKNNPRVSISRLLALVQHQVLRESRSSELPQVDGSLTAEVAKDGSRIASGGLNDSRLFQHAGGGVLVTQLLTDFGRTRSLVAAAQLEERSQQAGALATNEDVVLLTDQAFYDALEAQALLQVAQQSVAARQATESQVNQLTKNNLRSTLDLTFANVDLSQSQLQQLDAVNNASAAMAALDEVLGLDHEVNYVLVDDASTLAAPPLDVQTLIQTALAQRPDLQAADLHRQSQQKFSKAQSDQRLPTISTLGTVGGDPVRPGQYFISSWDGAVGANINIPIFNGFLYSAQAHEAELRANAASEQTRELRNSIVRNVETTWLQANSAYQRISVTEHLLEQANQSFALAQTRYQLGLSSIVELSQAQLQQTQAAISHTNAQYEYRLALATLNYQVGVQP